MGISPELTRPITETFGLYVGLLYYWLAQLLRLLSRRWLMLCLSPDFGCRGQIRTALHMGNICGVADCAIATAALHGRCYTLLKVLQSLFGVVRVMQGFW